MTAGSRREEARYRREFLAEAEGLLEQAAEGLAGLRERAVDPPPDVVNGLFRAFHSLKGLASMVGLTGASSLAHEVEALLDGVRMGRLAPDEPLLGLLQSGLDALGSLTARVARGEEDPPADPELADGLRRAREPRPAAPPAGEGAAGLPPELEAMLTDYERHRLGENVRRGRRVVVLTLDLALETFDTGLRSAMEAVRRGGELIGTFPGGGSDPARMTFRLLAGLDEPADPAALAAGAGASRVERLEPAGPPGVAASRTAPAPPAPPDAGAPPGAHSVGGTVRVPLEKIGTLIDLAGELALSRWALKRSLDRALASSTDRQARFDVQKAFSELDRGITALGRAALATRLVPVEQLAGRLGRTVASLGPRLGKEVELSVVGGETEADKILADALSDPLLHLVRNAVDHGVETPAERIAAGKPRAGRIVLTAAARGRDIVFHLSDDGRGIDPERIVAAARARGLLGPAEPDPAEPLDLLFRPGFSTAENVSETSGRGVGLDVVRTNLAALKGTVSVSSRKGEGTSFEVVVPMTLVLVESLLVRSGGLFFAVPASGVRRAFRAEPSQVETVDGVPVVPDDGTPLPLVALSRLLDIPEEGEPPLTVVVAEQGTLRAGLLVSAIEGIEDVIVKPLPGEIPRAAEITGAAELPGGGLALVLDTGVLLSRALTAAPGGVS